MVGRFWSLLVVAAAAATLAAPASAQKADAQKDWLDVNDPSITALPRYKRSEPLGYPIESMRANETGTIIATMCINAKGHVSNVELIESTPYKRLNDTTRRWFMKVLMFPAEIDGKPVPVCGYVRQQNWGGEITREERRETLESARQEESKRIEERARN